MNPQIDALSTNVTELKRKYRCVAEKRDISLIAKQSPKFPNRIAIQAFARFEFGLGK